MVNLLMDMNRKGDTYMTPWQKVNLFQEEVKNVALAVQTTD